VLPAANRLREGKDFARTTKTGVRATSPSLVLYVLNNLFSNENSSDSHLINQPRVGLIVNKSVGGSVVRHRVSRQLRHLIAQDLFQFPKNSTIVIRVLKKSDIYSKDLSSCINGVKKKFPVLL
jgi:ribonuclease P protein component